MRPAMIEALESRIAPAALTISADHKTAHWTDVDGDTVTLTASKPVFDPNSAGEFVFLTEGAGQQLALLDLHSLGAAAKGVALTFSAKRDLQNHQGDGNVNVGRIDATGIDLGAVTVQGDLGSIAAGDSTLTTPAVASITVKSAGAFGTGTQGAMLNGQATHLDWFFVGKVGNVTIRGDDFVALDADDSPAGGVHTNLTVSIGQVKIGGNLAGGSETQTGYTGIGSGYLYSAGTIGAVTIGGDIIGGSSQYGGSITAGGNIAGVSVGGDLSGGSADDTAEIGGAHFGKISIGGSIFGSGGQRSGSINATYISSLALGGSLEGGGGANSGSIMGEGPVVQVTIGGDISGGAGGSSGQLLAQGALSIAVHGSLIGGSAGGTGEISGGFFNKVTVLGSLDGTAGVSSGAIMADYLGAVVIGGTISGGSGQSSGSVFSDGSMGIGSVAVGGSLFGGSASHSGEIYTTGPLGKTTVAGSIVGGNSPRDNSGNLMGTGSGQPYIILRSGDIASETSLGAVTVGGNVIAGQGYACGAILTGGGSHGNITSVTIHGTLEGFTSFSDGNGSYPVENGIYADGQLGPVVVGAISGRDPASPAQIVAQGKASPAGATAALAIASVTVSRGVYAGEILAGYNAILNPTNPDVHIGAIKVGTDFVGSSISAGVTRAGSGFGDAPNTIVTPATGFTDSAAIRSQIASLTVGGYILGNPTQAQNFVSGIVAQNIGAVKIDLQALELTPTTAMNLDVFALGVDGAFIVREVP